MNAKDMALKRQRWRERGVCTSCGSDRDIEGIQCSRCRAMNRKSQRKTSRETHRGYQAALIARRRKAGHCPYCGQDRNDLAFKMCSKCRTTARERYGRNWLQVKLYRIEKGISNSSSPVPQKATFRAINTPGATLGSCHLSSLTRWRSPFFGSTPRLGSR